MTLLPAVRRQLFITRLNMDNNNRGPWGTLAKFDSREADTHCGVWHGDTDGLQLDNSPLSPR